MRFRSFLFVMLFAFPARAATMLNAIPFATDHDVRVRTTITADHGELFGESGFFGHGPIMHKKVFEVPLIEGKIR